MKKNPIKQLFQGFGCQIRGVINWNNVFHRHDAVQFGFYDLGPVTYQMGAHIFQIMQDECFLLWGAIPHMLLESPPNNVQYWVTIPLEMFINWALPEEFTHGVLNAKIYKADHGHLIVLDKLKMNLWKEHLANEGDKFIDAIMLDIESRIRYFGLEASPYEANVIVPQDRKLFFIVYDYISNNFYNDIKIIDIAKHAKVHPNYLMTVFKKSCGRSLTEVITMLRLFEAQRLLTTSSMNILNIALESGFGSLSSFYYCFTKHCGKSPKEYRKSVRPIKF